MKQLLGQRLGRYRLETLLGEGGMGSVYRGYDETLQRDVAIKILAPQFARQPNFRERFLQEARSAARLRHPGIVQVFDFGEAPSFLYIVMEFIPGDSLQELMRDLRSDEQWILLSEAINLIRQICLATDYAHRNGVLHRDIKPANVMLRQDPSDGLPYQPILTDLGLAKLAEGGVITQVGTSMGTPAYMSPEQALGETTDRRSDVYSIGVLLYELATGRLPFPIRTLNEAIRYHVKEPPPPPQSVRQGLNPEVAAIILKTIEKAPDNRYQDARALAEALEGVLAETRRAEETQAKAAQGVSLLTLWEPSVQRQKAAAPEAESEVEGGATFGGQLLVMFKDRTNMTLTVSSKGLTVGRDKSCELVLDQPSVSRKHARIYFDGRDCRVVDLGSTNGTFLNDLKLLPDVPEVLEPGSVVRIADVWLRLEKAAIPARSLFKVGDETQIEGGVIETSPGTGQVGVQIESTALAVMPGERLAVWATIFNQGALVDHFHVSVQGIPPEWIVALPPPVQLMPGQQQQINLEIQPPRSAASRAGERPFVIRVASQAAPDQAAELAAMLRIGSFRQFGLDLRPRRQTGISDGVFKVVLRNDGNADLPVTLEAVGSESLTQFRFQQAEVVAPAGSETTVDLTASSTMGPPADAVRQHHFTVLARPKDAPEMVQQAQATWEQGLPTFSISLSPERQQSVAEATYQVTVSNQSTSLLAIRLEASDPGSCCLFALQPAQASLDPGQSFTASLKVQAKVPLSGDAPQTRPFTVKAIPLDAPNAARQADGEWKQIPPAFTLELRPTRQSGTFSSVYTLRAINDSEQGLHLRLEASNVSGNCLFELEPNRLVVPPQRSSQAQLTVQPRQAISSAQSVSHTFSVAAWPEEASGVVRRVEGEWIQVAPTFNLKLSPKRVSGRKEGVFTVTLANLSDGPMAFQLEAADDEGACTFKFDPLPATLAANHEVSVGLTAQPKRYLSGDVAKVHAITVSGWATEAPRVVQQVQGEWEQLPGGRALWLSLPLALLAWLVMIAGWGLAFGLQLALIQAIDNGDFGFLIDQMGQAVGFDLAVAIVVALAAAAAGAVGGLLTGIAARLAEPSAGFGKILGITFGWALAWVAAWVALFLLSGLSISYVFGSALFVINGALGGLLMGLILQRTELDFSGVSVLLLVIGWALAGLLAGLALSAGPAESVAHSTGLASLFGEAFGVGAVEGAVYGIVGGLATLGLIGRAQQ